MKTEYISKGVASIYNRMLKHVDKSTFKDLSVDAEEYDSLWCHLDSGLYDPQFFNIKTTQFHIAKKSYNNEKVLMKNLMRG